MSRVTVSELLLSDKWLGSLCCECGTFKPGVTAGRNTASTNYELYDPDFARERLAYAERELAEDPGRKTTQRFHACWLNEVEHEFENRTCDVKCRACGRVTRHATVVGGGSRDFTEAYNYRGHAVRR